MKRILLPLGTLLAVGLALAVPAFAVPAGAAAADTTIAQASPAPSPSPSASPTPKPFQMSGFLDTGYTSATNSNATSVIGGRVFDTVSGSPQVHSLNLQASYTGTVGGKIEITYGDDGEYLHSYPQIQGAFGSPPYPLTAPNLFTYGPGISSKFDLTQAYGSYSTGKLTLIGGKFATLAGAEVIESPSDLNISRSILFGFAIPFTHTGARLTFAATPQISLIVGANRGWDTTKTLGAATNGSGGVAGDNSAFTWEFGGAWNPSSAFSLTAQGYTGKVDDWAFVGCANTSCNKQLVDVVATYHYNSAITAMANVDLASQTNTFGPFAGGVGTATWKGVAGYLSDALSSKLTATIRYEIFADFQGYRIGNGVGTKWTEGTLTGQYAATPNLTLRAEWRSDGASQPMFANKAAILQKTNSGFGLEALLHAP